MLVDLEDPPVSKKKPGRPKAEIDTEPVRIRSDLVKMARWVAMARGVRIGELLSDIVEPHIRRAYDAVEKPKDIQ